MTIVIALVFGVALIMLVEPLTGRAGWLPVLLAVCAAVSFSAVEQLFGRRGAVRRKLT